MICLKICRISWEQVERLCSDLKYLLSSPNHPLLVWLVYLYLSHKIVQGAQVRKGEEKISLPPTVDGTSSPSPSSSESQESAGKTLSFSLPSTSASSTRADLLPLKRRKSTPTPSCTLTGVWVRDEKRLLWRSQGTYDRGRVQSEYPSWPSCPPSHRVPSRRWMWRSKGDSEETRRSRDPYWRDRTETTRRVDRDPVSLSDGTWTTRTVIELTECPGRYRGSRR